MSGKMKDTNEQMKNVVSSPVKKLTATGTSQIPNGFEYGELMIIKELIYNCTIKGSDAMMIGLMINKIDDMIQLIDKGTIKKMDGSLDEVKN